MLSIRKALICLRPCCFGQSFVARRRTRRPRCCMEEPYGFFGTLNPTGHNAIYFERICAETPVKLRRCQPGELGAVIARYQGIDGYDWVAIPLIPYLYSVENAADVPCACGSRHGGAAAQPISRSASSSPRRETSARATSSAAAGRNCGRGLRAPHLCLSLRDHSGTGRRS